MRVVLQVAFLVIAMLAAGSAEAKCAFPRPVLSPANGAALPLEASVYLFLNGVEPYASVRALEVVHEDDGEPLVAKVTALPSPKAFRAFRLDLRSPREGAVRVEIRTGEGDEPLVARYALRRDSAAPVRHPLTVEKVEEELRSWTCSWQSTRNVTVSATAPAYRVEWAASEADYRSGKRSAFVVPHRMESFFHWAGAEPLPETGMVELGHVNCHGHTFEWPERPIYLGIVALNADGTESAAPEAPTRVEPPSSKDGTAAPKLRGVSIMEFLGGKRQPD